MRIILHLQPFTFHSHSVDRVWLVVNIAVAPASDGAKVAVAALHFDPSALSCYFVDDQAVAEDQPLDPSTWNCLFGIHHVGVAIVGIADYSGFADQ